MKNVNFEFCYFIELIVLGVQHVKVEFKEKVFHVYFKTIYIVNVILHSRSPLKKVSSQSPHEQDFSENSYNVKCVRRTNTKGRKADVLH